MVSPASKNAALIDAVPLGRRPDIAENGSKLILATVQCFGESPSCVPVRENVGVPYMFSRTPDGWAAKSLAPPATEYETNTPWLFNANTETGIFSMPTPPDGEDDFYARSPQAQFTDIGPLSPPNEGPNLLAVQRTRQFAGSADLERWVFEGKAIWPGSGQGAEGEVGALYQYAGRGNREPRLVGVSGGLGSTSLISECITGLGNKAPGVAGDESADGRVVYFTSVGCGSGTGANAGFGVPVREVFARVGGAEPGARTIAVSEPQAPQEPSGPQTDCTTVECLENTSAGNEGAWQEAVFWGATDDGSGLFTSAQQLTDSAVEGSTNLYMYDMGEPEGSRLLDVSAGSSSPRVHGVYAYSTDGSHVYFIAQGVLTGAANSGGQVAVEGAQNLYVYEHDSTYPEGHVAFIAQLNASDAAKALAVGPDRPGNVSPGGRFLVFTSKAALTGDVTRTDGAEQVYRYDAVTGGLSRISFGMDGFNDDGNGGSGDALLVPGFFGYGQLGGGRSDPSMSNDGSRVFFMSPVALTAKALASVRVGVNGRGEPLFAENVYEWEQAGVGSCSVGHTAGCVFLISGIGDVSTAAGEMCPPSVSSVCLLGTDASGDNVFFTSATPLVRSDTDTEIDVYDARVCEPEHGNPCISEPPEPAPPCLGESCHGTPPATPGAPSTPSSTFNGSGNLKPAPPTPPAKSACAFSSGTPSKACTRKQNLTKALTTCKRRFPHKKKKRQSCERTAHRNYGPVKRKKSTSKKGG